ncbi:hypothetical protein [Paludibacterium purpuratum]|uniref:SmpA/OmlA family protein n=1 Tax=Paludibacterium purpuratum TaxID=1144873 RepID=A0A4R7BE09_9NEIS|nr:hypothetical protein [Paludibacterium purpuratum]TDR81897.1 hypothetical protein DFP86_1027 [Paludibacterium purpuratum]
MKTLKSLLITFALIFGVSAHADVPPEVIQKLHDLTHHLVRVDSLSPTGIKGLVPGGVYRMSAEAFANQKQLPAFTTGKSTPEEVKQALGEPAGNNTMKDGRIVYSYDFPQEIVTYVFDASGKLQANYGYFFPLLSNN